jgi:putative heme iron utilization protein
VNEALARRAAELLRNCRVAALGTLQSGAPSVSMVPYAIIDDPLTFVVMVSALAAHTREMREDPRVALMIMEPESRATLAHALARVAMPGIAEAVSPGHARFGPARAMYVARFPEMGSLFELGDFALFAIAPGPLRVVAGFAEAGTLAPDDIVRGLRREREKR